MKIILFYGKAFFAYKNKHGQNDTYIEAEFTKSIQNRIQKKYNFFHQNMQIHNEDCVRTVQI